MRPERVRGRLADRSSSLDRGGTNERRSLNMTATRVLSWVELGVASLLAVLSTWLLIDLRGAAPEVDPHGYFVTGGIAGLIMACALAFGGFLLRISSKWRWLGQIPVAALLIALCIFT